MRLLAVLLPFFSLAPLHAAEDLGKPAKCSEWNESSRAPHCVEDFKDGISRAWHPEFGHFMTLNGALEPNTPVAPIRSNLPLQPVQNSLVTPAPNQASEISVLLYTGAEKGKIAVFETSSLSAQVTIPSKPGRFAGVVAGFGGEEGKRDMYAGILHYEPLRVAGGQRGQCSGKKWCAQIVRYIQETGLWRVIESRPLPGAIPFDKFLTGRLELDVEPNRLVLKLGKHDLVKLGDVKVSVRGQVGIVTNFDNEAADKERAAIDDFRLVASQSPHIPWEEKSTLVNKDNSKVLLIGTSACVESKGKKGSGGLTLNVDTDRYSALRVLVLAPCDLDFHIAGDFASHVTQVSLSRQNLDEASKARVARTAIIENLSVKASGRIEALTDVGTKKVQTCVMEEKTKGDCVSLAEMANNVRAYFSENSLDGWVVRDDGFFHRPTINLSEILVKKDLID